MLRIILVIIASYLIGAVPTAYWYGKLFKGIDIRQRGSGNIGATNALRVFGKTAGIIVLSIDVLKGCIPVIFFADYCLVKENLIHPDLVRLILGFTAIIGHIWTVFLNLNGGKGVATTFGVLLGLSFRINNFGIILGLIILTWFAVFAITRIVSLSSITSGIVLPLLVVIFHQSAPIIIFSFVVAAFIIFRHKANIRRLLEGKEKRINFRKKIS